MLSARAIKGCPDSAERDDYSIIDTVWNQD